MRKLTFKYCVAFIANMMWKRFVLYDDHSIASQTMFDEALRVSSSS